MHKIENFTTDQDDHISYGMAKSWLSTAFVQGCAASAAACLTGTAMVGFILEGASFSEYPSMFIVLIVMLGSLYWAWRVWGQVTTAFDPIIAGKVLDARTFEAPAEKDEMTDAVDRFDSAVQRSSEPIEVAFGPDDIDASEALA